MSFRAITRRIVYIGPRTVARRFVGNDAFRQTLLDDERRLQEEQRIKERLVEYEWKRINERMQRPFEGDVLWPNEPEQPHWSDTIDRHSDAFIVGFVSGAVAMLVALIKLGAPPPSPPVTEEPK